jgi:hypothetical protein
MANELRVHVRGSISGTLIPQHVLDYRVPIFYDLR